jgi:hypothetical protein
MVRIFVVLFLLLAIENVKAQNNLESGIKFCDGFGERKAATINITRAQLNKCDFSIYPTDTSYKITSFSLEYFDKDNKSKLKEFNIQGNLIPENFRKIAISNSGKLLIEHVHAKGINGTVRLLEATQVNIK